MGGQGRTHFLPDQMESINAEITAIHRAYCESTSYEIPMLPQFERQWFEALKTGLTPDCIRLVVKSRLRRVAQDARRPESLLLRNFCGNEAAICDVIQEAAAIRAGMRIKTFAPGKAEVLRATGRTDEAETGPVRHVSEVIAGMRAAVG